jgi:hypothetical protein
MCHIRVGLAACSIQPKQIYPELVTLIRNHLLLGASFDIPGLTLVSTPVGAAVPEPGSLVLLASAFLGFGVLRGRRKGARQTS